MPDFGSNKPKGENLPLWMSSRDSELSIHVNKPSKLLEGVVLALSGFFSPESNLLRFKALQLGAQFQDDWNPNCTLLVCAVRDTPKFREVEAENGTIVSREWINDCYNFKELVDIEPFLLHAGKPWRNQSSSVGPSQDPKPQTTNKPAKIEFSTSEVKKWAIEDMKKMISWLISQEEKPDPSEIKQIAAAGILRCLQDAIDSLNEGRGMEKIIEWSFVPRVVEELNKLDTAGDSPVFGSKNDIYNQAIVCKRIYEFELENLKDDKTDNK